VTKEIIVIIRRRLIRRESLILKSGQLSCYFIISLTLANISSNIIAAYLFSIVRAKKDLLVYSPQTKVIKSLLN